MTCAHCALNKLNCSPVSYDRRSRWTKIAQRSCLSTPRLWTRRNPASSLNLQKGNYRHVLALAISSVPHHPFQRRCKCTTCQFQSRAGLPCVSNQVLVCFLSPRKPFTFFLWQDHWVLQSCKFLRNWCRICACRTGPYHISPCLNLQRGR